MIRYVERLSVIDTGQAAAITAPRPHLRWLSDNAVVLSYTRLTQRLAGGDPITASCCETRIWQRISGNWQQVHVHRS
jgi:calcium/calmodulin-dependent protein kinase (CaM kinase) II